MVLLENFRIAFAALRANKMRSMLTMLGIIIGVAGVVAVVSVVQGLQYMVSNQLQDLGATYIDIIPQQQFGGPGMVAKEVKLTWEDGEAIYESVPGIEVITPQMFGNLELRYQDEQFIGPVVGTMDSWSDVNNFAVDRGRFFSRIDLEQRNKVAVIGIDVIDELGLPEEPIGEEIYVGRLPVTIIGVMEEKGRAFGFNNDEFTFVPFDTALSLFGRRAGDQVILQLNTVNEQVVEQVKDGIARVLRTRHQIGPDDPDDFQIRTQDQLLDLFNSILGGVTAVAGAIVSIALLVGGIGIMNIMLVSVTERTREIGVRKAVGARRRDVLVQFLIEAVTLSLIGGAVGLALGYGAGVLAASLIPGGFPTAYVPVWAVVLAFGFSAGVGVVFGVYPAIKAAWLDPIDALRFE